MSISNSFLPDELWRRILEIGIKTSGFRYKDLCSISISCRRLRRLSNENSLWSHLLSSDFPTFSSSSSSSSSTTKSSTKTLYRERFERDREKKLAVNRRIVLRKESQIVEHSRKIREIETRLADENHKLKTAVSELSHLRLLRQASVALNVWQPEVIRGRQKEIVGQCVVPVESRIHALEMELRLCKQQILGFEKAHKDEKRRLDTAKEELVSMKYHPLRDYTTVMNVGDKECNIKRKKLKRCHKGDG
ncbi:hypothetical protein SO802_031862 [Lithocarpus litseifolius]|uniref:F-box domain-containing protein n=1 Tax=Lithocarpus litseifolius TaxID=425828 RepID=A0AAW2BLG0_9ROSI